MKNTNNDSNRRGAGEKGSREWRLAGVMRDYSSNYPVATPKATKQKEAPAPEEEKQHKKRFILDLRRGR